MDECKFCAFDGERYGNLIFAGELSNGTLYLMTDQTLPGRCIYAFKRHVKRLTELSGTEYAALWDEVRDIALALERLYRPDKINYLVLGDRSEHLHVHIVPKYKDKPEWGRVFTVDREGYSKMSPSEKQAAVTSLNNAILGVKNERL